MRSRFCGPRDPWACTEALGWIFKACLECRSTRGAGGVEGMFGIEVQELGVRLCEAQHVHMWLV